MKSIESGERLIKFASTQTFFLFEKALIICKSKGNSLIYKETLFFNEYIFEDSSAPVNQTTSALSLDLFDSAVNAAVSGSGAYAHSLAVYDSNKTKVNQVDLF